MLLGRVLLASGVALIAHAAVAAAQYLALVETRYAARDAALPSDVLIELALAFVLVLAGALATAPAFASIYTAGGAPMECVPAAAGDSHAKCGSRCVTLRPHPHSFLQRVSQAVRGSPRL